MVELFRHLAQSLQRELGTPPEAQPAPTDLQMGTQLQRSELAQPPDGNSAPTERSGYASGGTPSSKIPPDGTPAPLERSGYASGGATSSNDKPPVSLERADVTSYYQVLIVTLEVFRFGLTVFWNHEINFDSLLTSSIWSFYN